MLIVAGDAHIGSGSSLGRLPDQESSWRRLCTTAVELGADVVGTGDWLHHRKPAAAEFDAFQSGLRILRDGGREFVTIVGNHEVTTLDAVSCLEVACAGYEAIVLRGARVLGMQDGTDVAFLPWAPFADARQMVADLMTLAEGMARDGARILVAHWALSGASLPTGLPVLELAEPVLDSFALAQMGFDVVLSGHIHSRQIVVEEPLVAHAGPLCRGNFGEAGIETGAWQIQRGARLVEGPPVLECCGRYLRTGECCSQPVPGQGEPEQEECLQASWFEVPDRAFLQIEADVREWPDPTAALLDEINMAQGVGDAIVRIRWSQRADQVIDTAAILAMLAECGAHRIDRLEPIVERIQSTRSAGVTESTPAPESWDRWQAAQGDVVSSEIGERVRVLAHERIGGAS